MKENITLKKTFCHVSSSQKTDTIFLKPSVDRGQVEEELFGKTTQSDVWRQEAPHNTNPALSFMACWWEHDGLGLLWYLRTWIPCSQLVSNEFKIVSRIFWGSSAIGLIRIFKKISQLHDLMNWLNSFYSFCFYRCSNLMNRCRGFTSSWLEKTAISDLCILSKVILSVGVTLLWNSYFRAPGYGIKPASLLSILHNKLSGLNQHHEWKYRPLGQRTGIISICRMEDILPACACDLHVHFQSLALLGEPIDICFENCSCAVWYLLYTSTKQNTVGQAGEDGY